MSSLFSQAHAFYQPVGQRLSWLHRWSIPLWKALLVWTYGISTCPYQRSLLSFRVRSRSSVPSGASSSLDLDVFMLMSTHNICFYGEIRKKSISEYSPNIPPEQFLCMTLGHLGGQDLNWISYLGFSLWFHKASKLQLSIMQAYR